MNRLALSLTAAAVLLTACSSDAPAPRPGGPTTAPEATTLEFLLFGGPEELEAYTTVADAFHAENPTITVEVSTVAKQDDLLARLTSSFAAGSPPDVFLINFRKYGLYAEQNVLAPVQDFLATSTALDVDDFFAEPLKAFQFEGPDQTCLPQNISSLVTYVNLDLFEEARVEVPTGDWNWDQFNTTATTISALGPDIFGIGTSPSFIRLAPMVWSSGGEVVDDPVEPTRLTLDTPAGRQALEFFALLVAAGLAPDDLAEAGRDSEARFIDGDLGMYWSSRRDVPAFRAAIDSFDWDVVPFPLAPSLADGSGEPGERVTMLHSDAFCIAAGTGNEDAAWRFIEYALGPEGAPVLAESGRTVPSIMSVANSPAFLRTDVPPANARVFLDNAEIVRATPSTATWNEVENQADDILEELFYGRITLERAIERLTQIRFR